MKRALILLLLLSGCEGVDLGIGGDGNGDDIFGGDNGDEAPARAADEVIDGDLSEGEVLSDLDWAEALFCWPGNENMNFDGAHVFYERTQDPNRDFFLRADPDSGVDVSVYYIQRTAGDASLPPDTSSAFDCDAMYDWESDSNPGTAEVIQVVGTNSEFSLLIGVAGAGGATSGAYTLEIWDEPGAEFDDE